jgi:cation:H+ antiporter
LVQQAAVLVTSLVLVTLGAEWLVRGASLVSLRAGLSPLFVGLTVVGFGTSTPELATSIVASLQGSSGIAVGNVIGSNIFNVMAILGVTALVTPIRVRVHAIRRDLWIGLLAGLSLYGALLSGGELQVWWGVGLLLALLGSVGFAYRSGRRAKVGTGIFVEEQVVSTFDIESGSRRLRDRLWFNCLLMVIGLLLLGIGSRWFVVSALQLARFVGVPELVIGLTIVAVGTSLPELVTTLVAARRGNSDLAIGNILGSNIFNLLGILGVASLVHPQQVTRSMLFLDVPVMLIGTLLLFPITRTGGMISRREGLLLFLGYLVYLVLQGRRAISGAHW